jgi:hypothetical protein
VTAANLRGPHTLSEIIGYTWRVYARNFAPLFLVALVSAPMAMLSTIIVRRIDDAKDAQIAAIYLQIPSAIIEFVAVAGIILAVMEISEGTAPEAGRALDTGLQKFWTIVTAELLAGMRVLLAVLAVPFLAIYWLTNREATIDGRRDWYFAVIPGALCVYLVIRWYFVPNAIVIQNKRSWAALDESADAVRDSWWRTAGIVLVIALIQFGFTVSAAGASAYAPPLVDGAVSGLVNALILPFAVTAQTLLYYDLKARHAIDNAPPAVDAPEPDIQG